MATPACAKRIARMPYCTDGGGVIEGNTIDGGAITGENFADSYLDVKGVGYRIDGNTLVNPSPSVLDGIQTHAIVDGGGSGNSFAASSDAE